MLVTNAHPSYNIVQVSTTHLNEYRAPADKKSTYVQPSGGPFYWLFV